MLRISKTNRIMLNNTSSLVGTTVVTSAFGFLYWWLAAHEFPPEAVGLASAAISAMLMLGTIGVFGFGTLLIGELPRQPGKEGALITSALIVVGIVSGFIGLVFVLIVSTTTISLRTLFASYYFSILFVIGVSLTAIAIVLDQAVIGLLFSSLQLWRNIVFSVTKMLALLIVSIRLIDQHAISIYATWVFGNLISIMALVSFVFIKSGQVGSLQPQWKLLRQFGRNAFLHHILNLSLDVPGWVLPLLVTILLSARLNAYFYTAWMIATFAFVGLSAITTVLYAVGAADSSSLAQKIRLTLKISFFGGLLAFIALLLGSNYVLHFFGEAYANSATGCLRILGFAIFPLIIRNHYVAIYRIRGFIGGAAIFMVFGGLLEVFLAAFGAKIQGLIGLSTGWVIAVCVEAVLMSPAVFRVAFAMHNQTSINKTAL